MLQRGFSFSSPKLKMAVGYDFNRIFSVVVGNKWDPILFLEAIFDLFEEGGRFVDYLDSKGNGVVWVIMKTEWACKKIVNIGSITCSDKVLPVLALNVRKVWMTVKGFLPYTPVSNVVEVLKPYGQVLIVEHEVFAKYPEVRTANFRVQIAMKTPVPNLCKIGNRTIICLYPGVVKLCNQCFSPGHVRVSCTAVTCGKCKSVHLESAKCRGKLALYACETLLVQKRYFSASESKQPVNPRAASLIDSDTNNARVRSARVDATIVSLPSIKPGIIDDVNAAVLSLDSDDSPARKRDASNSSSNSLPNESLKRANIDMSMSINIDPTPSLLPSPYEEPLLENVSHVLEKCVSPSRENKGVKRAEVDTSVSKKKRDVSVNALLPLEKVIEGLENRTHDEFYDFHEIGERFHTLTGKTDCVTFRISHELCQCGICLQGFYFSEAQQFLVHMSEDHIFPVSPANALMLGFPKYSVKKGDEVYVAFQQALKTVHAAETETSDIVGHVSSTVVDKQCETYPELPRQDSFPSASPPPSYKSDLSNEALCSTPSILDEMSEDDSQFINPWSETEFYGCSLQNETDDYMLF